MYQLPASPEVSLRRAKEAIEAVRSQADSLSRPEIRQQLWDELRSRGIMPAPPTVEFFVDDIMLGTGVAGRARRSAQRLGTAAELADFSIRLASAAMRHRPLPRWDAGGTRWVKPDPQLREQVVLDPAAHIPLAVGESDIIEVWLDYAPPGRDADSPGTADEQIAVFRGEQRVGLLGPEASHAYGRAVREAREADLIPLIFATRSRDDDGTWHLYLGLPAPGWLGSRA
jgi:hypothetical protein